MGNFFSNRLAPKASTHKQFVEFVVLAKKREQVAKELQKDGSSNNRVQLMTYKGKVIPGNVNQSLALPRSNHVKACKKHEGFLKTKKARELYGDQLTKKALTGLRQIRKGDKRFDVGLLDCFDGFVDPDTYEQLWLQRDATITRFSDNIDAIRVLREQCITEPTKRVRVSAEPSQGSKHQVEKAHTEAVASGTLFKLTCLPRENVEGSETQTNLACWLNTAFAAHPELREFRASTFLDSLFGAYPNKIMALNRELDDLYDQLHAGNHDADLLTQISTVGAKQAACIQKYLGKLALIGELLANRFPWEEAPFGSIGIAVALGADLNLLAAAHLDPESAMKEMHQFAIDAQAQVFAIRHGGQAAPRPSSWVDAVERTRGHASRQIDRLIDEMTPRAGESDLTPAQKTFAQWLNAHMATPASSVIGGDLNNVLDFPWSALQALDTQLRQLIHSRQQGVDDANLPRNIYETSTKLLALIDGHLGGIDALRRLAVVGAANRTLSPAQRELLTGTSQVLGRFLQRLKDPTGPLAAIRQRAQDVVADVRQKRDAHTQRVVELTADAQKAYAALEGVLVNPSARGGKLSDAHVKLRQWMTNKLGEKDAPTEMLPLTAVSANLFTNLPATQRELGRKLMADVEALKGSRSNNKVLLTSVADTAEALIQQIDAYLAQLHAVGAMLLVNPGIGALPIELEMGRIAAGQSMTRLWEALKHPEGGLMQLRAFAQKSQSDANTLLARPRTRPAPTDIHRSVQRVSDPVERRFRIQPDGPPSLVAAEPDDSRTLNARLLSDELSRNAGEARDDVPDVGAMSSAELASMLNVSLEDVEPHKPVVNQPGDWNVNAFSKTIDELLSGIPDEHQGQAEDGPLHATPHDASHSRSARRAHVSQFRRRTVQASNNDPALPNQPIQTKRRSANQVDQAFDSLITVERGKMGDIFRNWDE